MDELLAAARKLIAESVALKEKFQLCFLTNETLLLSFVRNTEMSRIFKCSRKGIAMSISDYYSFS